MFNPNFKKTRTIIVHRSEKCNLFSNLGEGRGVKMLLTYRQTDRHTEPLTKRVLEEHSLLKTEMLPEKFEKFRGYISIESQKAIKI